MDYVIYLTQKVLWPDDWSDPISNQEQLDIIKYSEWIESEKEFCRKNENAFRKGI